MSDPSPTAPGVGLEACPFCGGANLSVLIDGGQSCVMCYDCKAYGPLSAEEYKAAWNRRSQSAAVVVGGGVSACAWTQQEDGYDCYSTGCGHEFMVNDGPPTWPYCCYCAKPIEVTPHGELPVGRGWSCLERLAIEDLKKETGLSERALLRACLRYYQADYFKRKAGETVTWSGDAQRAADFWPGLNPGDKP